MKRSRSAAQSHRRNRKKNKMSKKTVKKVTKPLASALTVANPVAFQPDTPPEQRKNIAASVTDASKTPPSPTMPKESPPFAGSPAKPLPQPGPSKGMETPAALVKAPVSNAPPSTQVVFVHDAPQAKRVCLCGDFNQWSPEATPMTRADHGPWSAAVSLPPGRYQYKLVVDGQWVHDPNARENISNPHGSLNSVIEVRA